MDFRTLEAKSRETGKRSSRVIRREGQVPCVLYGQHTDPVHFRVPVLDMRPLIYTAENHLVMVKLGSDEFECILKTVDYHPVTDTPIHADFLALTAGETLTLTVPVVTVGTAPGIKAGGILSQPLNDLEISCLPKNIPGQVEVSIEGMEIGDSVHVSDIEMEDVEILTDPARTVVTITVPRAEEEPEEEEGLLLEGELAEGEEGELADGEEGDGAEGDEDEADG